VKKNIGKCERKKKGGGGKERKEEIKLKLRS
jgi:hypothetical protein